MSNLWLALLFFLVAGLLPADSVLAAGLVDLPGVELIGAEEVLDHYTAESAGGELLFRHADGSWVRLITSAVDPEIRNAGEGKFFPASIDEVETAVRAIPVELLSGVRVKVFLLPYPRSGMLGSSADGLAIYLTPGVRSYTPAEIHYLVAHELGHAFHRQYVPYGDAAWDRYRERRGIEDAERFAFDGAHAYRPQEIFAEDFRVLFGGTLARGDGGIENPEILRPDEVPALAEFFLDFLHGEEPTTPVDLALVSASSLRVFPNPVSPGGTLTLRGSVVAGPKSAAVFDVSGRRIGAVRFTDVGQEWSGSLERTLAPGAYWLRLELIGASPVSLPIRVSR